MKCRFTYSLCIVGVGRRIWMDGVLLQLTKLLDVDDDMVLLKAFSHFLLRAGCDFQGVLDIANFERCYIIRYLHS